MAGTAGPRSAGFSLIELMIGMLLGIILMAGAASIYLSSKRSFTEVEQVAALSDNARFSLRVLTDAMRHIGFTGQVAPGLIEHDPAMSGIAGTNCTGAGDPYQLKTFLAAEHVPGTYGDGANNTIYGCITDAKSDTDVLVIKHAVATPHFDEDPDNALIARDGIIDFPRRLDATKTYLMTNNAVGRIFDAGDPHPTIQAGGEVPNGVAWEYLFEIYYVRNTPVPQLARKFLSWNGTANEIGTENLVEGVENMRLRFGYDSSGDGDVDTYKIVTGVADWSRVMSIEASVLVRNAADDPQYVDTKTYNLGSGIAPILPAAHDPNFRRMIMTTSVSLRNMKLVVRGRT